MSPGITSWIRLAVLSGVAAVVSAFLGWQAGQISVPAGPPPAATPWVLPPRPTEDPARDLAILTARGPWTNAFLLARSAGIGSEQPEAARASNSKPPVWRLAGIVQRPGENFALIVIGQPDAAKLEYRRVGDSLPDGSTLVQITSDNAVAEPAGSSGEQRVYWLFRGKL
jgi:hypothetical protein